MKPFQIKFDGAKAIVSIAIQVEDQWFKRTLTAYSSDELWESLGRLLKIEELDDDDKKLCLEHISKASERASIEEALPKWLQAGNKIKMIPAVGQKLIISEALKEDILKDLGFEDFERGMIA